MNMKKTNKGITLVALVITIIILIILAGVSINAIMNEGIIHNAKDARDEFSEEKDKEQEKLTYIDALLEYANVEITNVDIDETNPEAAMPDGTVLIEGDANKGIVIKDTNNNEWVWVEVPKSIYTTTTVDEGYSLPTSSTDYTNIEHVLQKYASSYRDSDYTDTYYLGCGFSSETDYDNHKNSMLKSVYEYGGFWIGRYEAGIKTPRYEATDTLTDAVVQQNMYPYTWITIAQAQEKASLLATGERTSSLMFGIQWDLTMKFIEEKGYLTDDNGTITTTKITIGHLKNSEQFGNFCTESSFALLNRGQYTTDPTSKNSWKDFDISTSGAVDNKMKSAGIEVLLTTGAAHRFRVLNIYDIAGNVAEYTLERNDKDVIISGFSKRYYGISRGCNYSYTGENIIFSVPCTMRANWNVNGKGKATSFRPVMW